MFERYHLVKNNFFGYGIVLESDNEKSEVFFSDGKRTILNSHLVSEYNDSEYIKIMSLFNDVINKEKEKRFLEEEKKRLKEEEKKAKEKRLVEREEKRKRKRQEELEKEAKRKEKKDKIEKIQQEEFERLKAFSIYDNRLNTLKEYMYEDIYPIEKFNFYLRKNEIPLTEDVVEYALYYLGYRKRTKEIILSNRYKSVEEYYEEEASKFDRYFYNNKLNLPIYDDVLKRLERKMVLFEASPGVFITKRLMSRLGINQYTLKSFYEKIQDLGQELEVFSVKQIRERLTNDKIIEFASEASQIEKFVLAVPNIKSIQSDDNRLLFSFTNERFSKPQFLEMIFRQIDKIDIYVLKDKIEIDYDATFSIDSILYCVKNSSLYYNEEMETIYKNKKIFLEEIFNE